MNLSRFSVLVGAFAAGLVLSGCATSPYVQQGVAAQGYANASPVYISVTDPATGRRILVPAQQQSPQQGEARYPYGHGPQPQNYSGVGMLGGALFGNAVSHGNARAIAAGAVTGVALGGMNDPCATQPNAGTALGGILGFALGDKVGQGNGRKVASVAAALVGANAGGQMASGPKPPGCR